MRTIKNDVYLQEIIIWNNGNQPIEPDDVRAPITFELVPVSLDDSSPAPGQPRILEFKVANETSPSISMIEVHKKNTANNSKIVVDWKHLDRGQAANIQIIYTTPHNVPPEVSVSGQIVGISRLTNADAPAVARVAPWIPLWTIFPALLLFLALSTFFLFPKLGVQNTSTQFLLLIFSFLAICFFLFYIYLFL